MMVSKFQEFNRTVMQFRFSLATVIVLPSLLSCAVVIWLISYFVNDNYDLPVQSALFGSLIILFISSIGGLTIAYILGNWLLDFESHVANIIEKKTSRFKLRDYSKCWIKEVYDLAQHLDEIDRRLKNYHEALNRSNKHLNLVQNTILEASNDAIISINEKGTVKIWNRASEEIFGYSRKYAIGRCLTDLIIPEDFRKKHQRMVVDFFQRMSDSTVNEHSVILRSVLVKGRHAAGYHIPIEVTVCKISKQEVVGFIRDATEFIAKQELEEEYKQRLEREVIRKTYELSDAKTKLEQAYIALKQAGEIATHSIYLASLSKNNNGRTE